MMGDLPVSIAGAKSKVRAMTDADVPGIVALAARVSTAPHWPPAEFTRLARVSAERPDRRAAWAAHDEGGAVIGFAIAGHVEGTAELEAVVTAPERRREGVGTALVQAALLWSDAQGAQRLVLEVRASNQEALRLYARLGFRHDGLRRGYYHAPEEDAVLMSRLLGAPEAS